MPSWNLPWAYQYRSKVSPVYNPTFWNRGTFDPNDPDILHGVR